MTCNALLTTVRTQKGKKRARLQPLFVHPAYYALEQPRYTLKQLESLETPSGKLNVRHTYARSSVASN